MKRKFLDGKEPPLHLAARYLIGQHTEAGCLDMRSVTLVLPTHRAVYRLEELLAKAAADLPNPAWYPPEFLMPESLPEKFYEMKKAVANDVVQWFGWMYAVNRLEAENKPLLDHLLPKMPDDFESRLAFARMLAKLHYELAAEGIDFKQVVTKCEELRDTDEGGIPHWAEICRKAVTEIPRWKTLARLQEFYANADPAAQGFLDRLELWDLQSARLFAVKEQSPEEAERIRRKFSDEKRMFYLTGLADMNQLQKGILKKFDSFLTALVFAPEKEEFRFDAFGCLNTDEWADAPVEIADGQISVVWQPEQQADEVLRKIESLTKKHPGRYAAGDIVVGVPDKEVIPFVRQRFEQGNLPSRLIEGTSVRRTPVYRFLEVLLKYLKTRRFRDFAELVRHPDVEEYLCEISGTEKPVDVLTRLDKYHNEFFPLVADGEWKTAAGEPFDLRRNVWQPLHTLLDLPLDGGKIVSETPARWLDVIETALDRLFGNARSEQTREALGIVHRKIDLLRSQPIRIATPKPPKPMLEIGKSVSSKPTTGRPVSPKPTRPSEQVAYQEASFSEEVDYIGMLEYSDVLSILLTQLESEHVPPHEMENAVELIGWLDMAMDDTPVAIVTGMNEGFIPSFATSDKFLPDSLRRLLGVMDNRRRCARDAYALRMLLQSRANDEVLLIGGRRSVVGDPVIPSRFFFAAQNTETVARRVGDYFAEKPPEPRVRIKGTLQPDQEEKRTVAKLPEPSKPIHEIGVTALKEYPRCPYRFYLKHILKLKDINDDAAELPADEFGNLIHAALRRFGEAEKRIRDSTDATTIREFLHTRLERDTKERFGKSPRASIAIQIERAKNRLDAFADWQANRRAEGHRIEHVEYGSDKVFLNKTVLLKGRIDRIDRDEKTGDIVVWDYKTSKTENAPSGDRAKSGEWVDFQLPLYHHILRTTGVAPEGKISVGYLYLSRERTIKPKSIKWEKADIDDAVRRAEEILQESASGNFSPPDPPPKCCRYCKEFEFICQDRRR